jgi:hypothetical protein
MFMLVWQMGDVSAKVEAGEMERNGDQGPMPEGRCNIGTGTLKYIYEDIGNRCR